MVETARQFEVKDCALMALATGRQAHNLRELKDAVEVLPEGAIYYHFWGGRLRPTFDDPEYNNDFAAWAYHGLADQRSAERLSLIDPTQFDSNETLRTGLLEVLDECVYDADHQRTCVPGNHLDFKTSQIVVFDTHRRVGSAEELADVVSELSLGSVFYHFIDARRRTPLRQDDFSAWLEDLETKPDGLVEKLRSIDPYFCSLTQLREQIVAAFRGQGGAV